MPTMKRALLALLIGLCLTQVSPVASNHNTLGGPSQILSESNHKLVA